MSATSASAIMYFFTFIGGVVCKLYDDITDNHIRIPRVGKEVLKMLHTVLYTIISATDFNFSFAFYIVNFVGALANPSAWVGAYERACLYVLFLPCIVSFGYISNVKMVDIIIFLITFLGSILEIWLKFNEISIYKLLFRLLGVIYLVGVITLLNISNFTKKMFYYTLGYILASCIFQSVNLFWQPIKPRKKKRKKAAAAASLDAAAAAHKQSG